MSYFDLLSWLGRNVTDVLLWAFLLFAGAVVCSVPFMAFSAWRQHEVEKAKRPTAAGHPHKRIG